MFSDIHIEIIIPVYNAEKYIDDCLMSIINQEYTNWTVYCIDDGSEDNSFLKLQRYVKKDRRIIALTKKNGGAASARNFALSHIEVSENTWISFVDVDDYISPKMYSNIVNELCLKADERCDYVRIHCQKCTERPKNGFIADANLPKSSFYVDRSGYFDNGDVGGLVCSCFIKAQIVKNNNIYFPTDMKVMEDQVFSIQCALKSNMVLNYYDYGYYYYTNPTSVTNSVRYNTNDIVKCINRIYKAIANEKDINLRSYFYSKYLPPKIFLFLRGVMQQKGKSGEDINSEIRIGQHLVGFKTHILYFLCKLLGYV